MKHDEGAMADLQSIIGGQSMRTSAGSVEHDSVV